MIRGRSGGTAADVIASSTSIRRTMFGLYDTPVAVESQNGGLAMKRILAAAGFVAMMAASLSADVTIKALNTGKVLGMSGDIPTTTYVKGGKMRVELGDGSTIRTSIYDVDNQKLYMFDNKKKEADVWDMAEFSAEISKSVSVQDIKSSIKPNGQTKQVAGKTANGYDIVVTVPAEVGGMKMTMNLTGTTWVVKGAPGTADYIAFYKAAAQKGWIFGDPRAAKGQPGQAKAMSEMYEQFAKLDGLPYASEMNIKVSGEGPMAGMMAKMGNMTTTTTTQSVETTAIGADMFAPPAGYKLNVK